MVEDRGGAERIAGIVLAGGQARRLGGDKPFRLLGDRPLIAHAIVRAKSQVAALAISANEPPARFAGFGLLVLPDSIQGFAGPLTGILAGMDWAASQDIQALASFACDAPFFPHDLVTRLVQARADGRVMIATAASGDRMHPVFALWPVRLRDELRRAVAEEGVRKVEAWLARFHAATVDFPTAPFDPFFNVNTPDDLARAERLLAGGTSVDNEFLKPVEKS